MVTSRALYYAAHAFGMIGILITSLCLACHLTLDEILRCGWKCCTTPLLVEIEKRSYQPTNTRLRRFIHEVFQFSVLKYKDKQCNRI